MKDGLKTKQSEDQLLASPTVYAKCNYSFLLYQTHLIISPPPPPPTPYVLTQRQFVKLKQLHSASSSRVRGGVSLRPGSTPCVPLGSAKQFQMKFISIFVSVCVLLSAVCSKPRSPTASFHSSLAQIHALERLLKGSLFIRLTK